MIPTKIKIEEKDFLKIEWDDNSVSKIKLSDVRRECPCAHCSKERENDHGKFEVYTSEQITVKEINPIGTYAINIVWNDNHNTGFYEYSLIKTISKKYPV